MTCATWEKRISDNPAARRASLAGIAAQVGNKRRPGQYGEKPANFDENKLEQQFSTSLPDQVWVTDITVITDIKTHEGWHNKCVAIDLVSRRVVGWSAQSRMTTDLVCRPS